MASGTQSHGKMLDYEQFIDHQLSRTQARIKATDILVAVLSLLTAVLSVLFLEIILDHAVGLSVWIRRVVLAFGCLAAVAFAGLRIARPLIRRVNGFYAARTIEMVDPNFKNSLINYLDLRKHREVLPRRVLRAIEAKAVGDLTRIEVDAVVNQRRVLHTWYALMGVIMAIFLYYALAHKSMVDSVKRAFLADVVRPTDTRFESIRPGLDPELAEVVAGSNVPFSVETFGVRPERVVLHYSTDGGNFYLEQELAPGVQSYDPWQTTLRNVQQSISYYLSGADARSRDYSVKVLPAPMVTDVAIDYSFPPYTGVSSRLGVEGGNVAAIEGTTVIVHARTNQAIKSGYLSFGAPPYVPMTVDPQDAQKMSGRFLVRNDGSYTVQFRNLTGQANSDPVVYEIRVTKDAAPSVRFKAPAPRIKVPNNARVDLQVEAVDDFGVKSLDLSVVHEGESLVSEDLIENRKPERKALATRTLDLTTITPALKPGTVLEYSVAARDTKEPTANSARTEKHVIEIGAPAPPQELAKLEEQRQQNAPPPETADTNTGQKQTASTDPGSPPANQPSNEAQQPAANNRELAQNEIDNRPRDGQHRDDAEPTNPADRKRIEDLAQKLGLNPPPARPGGNENPPPSGEQPRSGNQDQPRSGQPRPDSEGSANPQQPEKPTQANGRPNDQSQGQLNDLNNQENHADANTGPKGNSPSNISRSKPDDQSNPTPNQPGVPQPSDGQRGAAQPEGNGQAQPKSAVNRPQDGPSRAGTSSNGTQSDKPGEATQTGESKPEASPPGGSNSAQGGERKPSEEKPRAGSGPANRTKPPAGTPGVTPKSGKSEPTKPTPGGSQTTKNSADSARPPGGANDPIKGLETKQKPTEARGSGSANPPPTGPKGSGTPSTTESKPTSENQRQPGTAGGTQSSDTSAANRPGETKSGEQKSGEQKSGVDAGKSSAGTPGSDSNKPPKPGEPTKPGTLSTEPHGEPTPGGQPSTGDQKPTEKNSSSEQKPRQASPNASNTSAGRPGGETAKAGGNDKQSTPGDPNKPEPGDASTRLKNPDDHKGEKQTAGGRNQEVPTDPTKSGQDAEGSTRPGDSQANAQGTPGGEPQAGTESLPANNKAGSADSKPGMTAGKPSAAGTKPGERTERGQVAGGDEKSKSRSGDVPNDSQATSESEKPRADGPRSASEAIEPGKNGQKPGRAEADPGGSGNPGSGVKPNPSQPGEKRTTGIESGAGETKASQAESNPSSSDKIKPTDASKAGVKKSGTTTPADRDPATGNEQSQQGENQPAGATPLDPNGQPMGEPSSLPDQATGSKSGQKPTEAKSANDPKPGDPSAPAQDPAGQPSGQPPERNKPADGRTGDPGKQANSSTKSVPEAANPANPSKGRGKPGQAQSAPKPNPDRPTQNASATETPAAQPGREVARSQANPSQEKAQDGEPGSAKSPTNGKSPAQEKQDQAATDQASGKQGAAQGEQQSSPDQAGRSDGQPGKDPAQQQGQNGLGKAQQGSEKTPGEQSQGSPGQGEGKAQQDDGSSGQGEGNSHQGQDRAGAPGQSSSGGPAPGSTGPGQQSGAKQPRSDGAPGEQPGDQAGGSKPSPTGSGATTKKQGGRPGSQGQPGVQRESGTGGQAKPGTPGGQPGTDPGQGGEPGGKASPADKANPNAPPQTGRANDSAAGGGTGSNNPREPERTKPVEPLPTNTDQPPANPGESVAPDVPQSELVTRTIKELIDNDKFTPELQKSLGMTRDEADQFVKKYEKRAVQPAADQGREIQARPGEEQVIDPKRKAPEFTTSATFSRRNDRSGTALATDHLSGLNDTDRLAPPPELLKQWRAYNRNMARPTAGATPPPASNAAPTRTPGAR